MDALPDAAHRLTFPRLPALHAWVVVDGAPLAVYGDEAMRERGEGYVEAVAGKTFTLCVADLWEKRPTFSWNIDILVDGSYSEGIVERQSSSMYDDFEERVWVGEGEYDHTESTVHRYRFVKVETTADENVAHADEAAVQSLGCIEFQHIRITHLREIAGSGANLVESLPIQEGDSKAELSHQVDLGDAEPSDVTGLVSMSFKRKDPRHKPYSRLKLFYRSRAFLQARGFIPVERGPSPSPSPSSAPSSNLEVLTLSPSGSECPAGTPVTPAGSSDRLALLEAQERAALEELARVRAERARAEAEEVGEVAEGKPSVKREREGEGEGGWRGSGRGGREGGEREKGKGQGKGKTVLLDLTGDEEH